MRQYILIGLCTLCMGLMVGEGFARGLNARTEALAGAGIGLIGSGRRPFSTIQQDWPLWMVGRHISRL